MKSAERSRTPPPLRKLKAEPIAKSVRASLIDRSSPLTVDYLPIEDIKLDSRNPRKHLKRQIKQIAKSMQCFGCIVPILIDEDSNILAGHGRWHAGTLLGLKTLPVIRITSLTKAQARAFAIADNKLTDNSSWDDRLLGEILFELSASDLDFNPDVTGFSTTEIDLRIDGLSLSASPEPDPADDTRSALDGSPVTQRNQMWRMEKHFLLCGNALEAATLERLMGDHLARMGFIDFPYNVSIRNHVSVNPVVTRSEFAMASGEMSAEEFTQFLMTAMTLLARHSTDGSLHFLCMDFRHIEELMTAAKQAYSQLVNLCVWEKHNAGMGSMYRGQHELVFVYKNGHGPHCNNIELGRHGRHRTNVWHYPGANNFGRAGEEGDLLRFHATPKPVAMIADAILDCTARGDIVLDSFIGIGSTLIAAERVGRICYGVEIEPHFIDVAVRRWQTFTGECAVDALTGERFDDLAAKAEVAHG